MNLNFLPATNWVDIIIVIFLIRGCYVGLNQGFSVELFKGLGALTATISSLLYYQTLGQWLTSHSFLSVQISEFISFLCLFLASLFTFRVVRILMFKVFHLELFFGLEKWGGCALGILRSILLVSLFLFDLTLLPVQYIKDSVEKTSLAGMATKEVAPGVFGFIMKFKPEDQ